MLRLHGGADHPPDEIATAEMVTAAGFGATAAAHTPHGTSCVGYAGIDAASAEKLARVSDQVAAVSDQVAAMSTVKEFIVGTRLPSPMLKPPGRVFMMDECRGRS